MIIDFSKITEQVTEKFKGGEGEMCARNFIDQDCKIMMSRLRPGASTGYHKHEGTCEIIYIIGGKGHFRFDDKEEPVEAGSVHYCPDGHCHAMFNDGSDDLVYFAIVPNLKR